MKILITGSSGFIGKNLIIKLLNEKSYTLYCLDIYPNELINNYKNNNNITFINDNILTTNIISTIKPDYIIHLAALSGVRDSKENPTEYMNINITGFTHIFEQARLNNIKKIIYASSSSVYGDILDVSSSLSENDVIGPAKSIYSLTKHMNEQIAKFYYDNYNINSIGLRFFTVYGPYGRSNMAISKFTESILNNNEITVYGDGEQIRDFTHVNDIINGIVLALQSNIKYDIFNIGTENTISINNLIKLIENTTGKNAQIKYLPRNESDVQNTKASIDKAFKLLKYKPTIDIKIGIQDYINHVKYKNKAFITSIFSEKIPIDIVGKFNRLPDWDYLLFTNLDINETTTSWTIIKIDPSKYCKTGSYITYSRLPKFNIMALVGTKYDIITYMDGYLSPIDDTKLWDTIISKLDDNDIIVEPHPSSRNPIEECTCIVKFKKDTITRMNLMTQYLIDNGINPTMDIPVYQNTYFTYSTKKDIIIKTFEDIWNFLLPNDITHRDQPIHSYFFYKNNIKPTFYKNITQKKLFNNTGKMGKHIYI